jgi:hypothetical protein
VPTRVNNSSGDVNKSGVDNNIINTGNNDSIDKPSINTVSNISIGQNNGGVDKTGIDKPNSGTQSKTAGMNNINAKRAKFEEDVKKEPILQTIIDVFDGELLS